jgi:hypothetical protein
MAEKENLQLAEQMIAAVNARDLDRYSQRIDDSYIGESEMIPEPVRGRGGVASAKHDSHGVSRPAYRS